MADVKYSFIIYEYHYIIQSYVQITTYNITYVTLEISSCIRLILFSRHRIRKFCLYRQMSERIYIKNILDALNPIKFQCLCLIVSIKYEGQVNLSVIYTDNTFSQHKYFFWHSANSGNILRKYLYLSLILRIISTLIGIWNHIFLLFSSSIVGWNI